MRWIYQLKMDLVTLTGLSKDALHIHFGLLALFAACIVFRWKVRDGKAVLLVLILELLNELSDLRYTINAGGKADWWDSVHDILNTMFMPVVLMILARATSIFARGEKARSAEDELSGD